MLIDSHCHIHDKDFPIDVKSVVDRARLVGVEKIICIGTDVDSSARAVRLADEYDNVFASIGVHPHESKYGTDTLTDLLKSKKSKIVAIGEIGLDYFYDHSPRETQWAALEEQIQLAIDNNLPISFHVREAYDDFWPIINNFRNSKLNAVLHSFTDSKLNLSKALSSGFYIGVNGFCTFIKDENINRMFDSIPMDRMLLETDAPYLTPKPFRGKINEPAYVKNIAEFIAKSRNIDVEAVAKTTSQNTCDLFGI